MSIEDILFEMKLAEASQILPTKLYARYEQYLFHSRVDNYLINVDNDIFFNLVQDLIQSSEAKDEKQGKISRKIV